MPTRTRSTTAIVIIASAIFGVALTGTVATETQGQVPLPGALGSFKDVIRWLRGDTATAPSITTPSQDTFYRSPPVITDPGDSGSPVLRSAPTVMPSPCSPDRQARREVTVRDAVGGRNVTIRTDQGRLGDIRALPAPTNLPGSVRLPFGLFAINVTNVELGATVTVTLNIPRGHQITKYMKQNEDGGLDEYPASIDDGVISFKITDGGDGDSDGEADGDIEDPGGPAEGDASNTEAAKSTDPRTATRASCGNGIRDFDYLSYTGEKCDDGNRVDDDGCSNNCVLNDRCGNGVCLVNEYKDNCPQDCPDKKRLTAADRPSFMGAARCKNVLPNLLFMSKSGRYIIFTTNNYTPDVPDSGGSWNLYVKDRQNGAVTLLAGSISVGGVGQQDEITFSEDGTVTYTAGRLLSSDGRWDLGPKRETVKIPESSGGKGPALPSVSSILPQSKKIIKVISVLDVSTDGNKVLVLAEGLSYDSKYIGDASDKFLVLYDRGMRTEKIFLNLGLLEYGSTATLGFIHMNADGNLVAVYPDRIMEPETGVFEDICNH